MIVAVPMAIAGITLVLVVKLSMNCQLAGGNIFFSGLKQPVSLVVTSPSVKKAFDVNGEEVPVSTLVHQTPGLRSVLEKA